MEIGEIREKVQRNEYEISFHAEKERYAEDIINERRRSRKGGENA